MESWLAQLACPKCKSPELREALHSHERESALNCDQCRSVFPILDGVPILFAQPESYLLLWAAKLQAKEQELADRIQKSAQSSGVARSPTTEGRVQKVLRAESENLEILKSLLPETVASFGKARKFDFLKMHETGIGDTQHLDSYLETIFRDWVWGKNEVDLAVQEILPRMSRAISKDSARIAVMGSGAGGLISSLARELPQTEWLCLDINPFLLQIHRRMLQENPLEYWEIPMNARCLEDVARKQVLKATDCAELKDRVRLIASDGLNPCLKPKSHDVVFCSWWVDIIPDDLQNVASRLNKTLVDQGLFIIHGPLGFSAPDENRSYTEEEILEWMPRYGFELLEQAHFEAPYLHSPLGRLKRTERISWMIFRKVAEAKPAAAFKPLPEYLLNFDTPIAPVDSFQIRAADSGLRQQVYSLIDGKRTFRELASLISAGLQIDLPTAQAMLFHVLKP